MRWSSAPSVTEGAQVISELHYTDRVFFSIKRFMSFHEFSASLSSVGSPGKEATIIPDPARETA